MSAQHRSRYLLWLGLLLLGVMVLAPAGDAQAADPRWFAQYFNNVNLSGNPVLERFEDNINYRWSDRQSPGPGVNIDEFSVRWTRNINFPNTGTYRFTATMDDGMRVFVNNSLVLNAWTVGQERTVTADVFLNAGDHNVRVEFFDQLLSATAIFSWQFVTDQPPPPPPAINFWRGEYFNNRDLAGSPNLIRDDASINFNWGFSSPSSAINADNFSVRWTRTLNLGAGRFRFVTTTDDGVRLWINGQLVIDQWRQQSLTSYTTDVDLGNYPVNVRMEYFELDRLAEARLEWYPVSSPPPPPPPPPDPGVGTATVVSARANVRQGPSTSFAIIATLSQGTVLQLGGYRTADNLWVQLILPDGTRGWTYAPLLRLSVPINSLAVWTQGGFPEGPWATMTGAYHLNVRRGPGVQFVAFTTIDRGTVVELHGRNAAATWVQIRLRDGRFGWVNASYLSTSVPVHTLPITG